VRFGVNILNYGSGASPEGLITWGKLAEDTGFDFLAISDHVAITDDVYREYQTPFYDPLVTLGVLACATRRVRLGTSVLVVPYRHPLLTARMTANLDQLSGGRMFLGVGAGWAQQEFDALGASFAARGEVTDEYLDVIRAAWANETVSYSGAHVAFSPLRTGPPPAQAGGVPLWVGGDGRAAMRRTVRHGAAWHPLRPRVGWLREHALPTLTRIAEDLEQPRPDVIPRIFLRIESTPLPESDRIAGHGTREQIRRDLEELAELGIADVLLDTYSEFIPGDGDDHVRHQRVYQQFAEEIVDLATGAVR
jgi:probable F420-dependent oxidoreductase